MPGHASIRAADVGLAERVGIGKGKDRWCEKEDLRARDRTVIAGEAGVAYPYTIPQLPDSKAMQLQASALLDKLKHCHRAISLTDLQLTTSQKVILWSLGVVGTSAVVVGILSRYLARRRAKPILNPRIQRAINKRISRMRSPNGGMGSVASSGGRSSPLGFSERLSLASGSIGSGGGDAAPLSPQQLGVMDASKDLNTPWARQHTCYLLRRQHNPSFTLK
ncbi:hypothetical protein MSG28_002391 [Choristoneura fumiferana]|uniref:Uncharacterized protein n=1 Tax=Choristoneura fumiferana TaxID=7141 RepID=A0ACC0JVV5_CHOFU|nr:hypothetical protein MSG28_002391 [Choristoneura fumiferana]